MRFSAVGLALIVLALTAPTASAARFPIPAAASIHRGVECPDGGGSCSYAATGEVFLAPGAGRFAKWHELGHVRAERLTQADRGYMIELMGLPPGPWDRGTGFEGGFSSPSEWFADYHAACALRLYVSRAGGSWEASYAPWPGARRYRRICNAIAVLSLVRG